MKTALITGGAGFIAHHLIARILTQTDWNIVTLDRLDYSGNLNRLNDILQYECTPNERKRVKVVWHDLKAELNPLVRREIGKVDYILHLAAGSHVDRSIDYPMEFVMDKDESRRAYSRSELLRGALLSINGIAAGMRNTG